MDYLNLNSRELALVLMYAAESGAIDPALVREAAVRIYPDIKKEPEEGREKRYRRMLGDLPKIQVIKRYRDETGVSLKDAKDYVDALLEKIQASKRPECICPEDGLGKSEDCPYHGDPEKFSTWDSQEPLDE